MGEPNDEVATHSKLVRQRRFIVDIEMGLPWGKSDQGAQLFR